ncbi:MAG: hypothetical protein QOI34_1025 [Verrucomicrobiota bacterium]|jgi:hypothetical protein
MDPSFGIRRKLISLSSRVPAGAVCARALICAGAAPCLLVSCELARYGTPPPVTSQMAVAGREQHVEVATLHHGRALFAQRCIECHTLPPVWHYRAEDWPEIVNDMSRRASLSPSDRTAILAYILAARREL